MKVKLNYSQVKEALEAGYASPLNSTDGAKCETRIVNVDVKEYLTSTACKSISMPLRHAKTLLSIMKTQRIAATIYDDGARLIKNHPNTYAMWRDDAHRAMDLWSSAPVDNDRELDSLISKESY